MEKKYFIIIGLFFSLGIIFLVMGLIKNPGLCLVGFFVSWLVAVIFVGLHDNYLHKIDLDGLKKRKLPKTTRRERPLPGI